MKKIYRRKTYAHNPETHKLTGFEATKKSSKKFSGFSGETSVPLGSQSKVDPSVDPSKFLNK